jgi:hypothetical protein
MTTIHTVIAKFQLNETCNYTYFENFSRLLDLPLSDDLTNNLIQFFIAISEYKQAVQLQMDDVYGAGNFRQGGFGHILIVDPNYPLEAYVIFGVVDIELMPKVRSIPEYTTFSSYRNLVFSELNWQPLTEKIVDLEINMDPERVDLWTNIPATFSEVATLYSTATTNLSDLGW